MLHQRQDNLQLIQRVNTGHQQPGRHQAIQHHNGDLETMQVQVMHISLWMILDLPKDYYILEILELLAKTLGLHHLIETLVLTT